MNLDLVLGLSCCNQSSITTDKVKGLIAYPASGVLVLFQPKLNAQVAYLRVRKNAISCASFSPDGQYIVTGERGYRPVLRVWSVDDGMELASMPGHEFGIKAVLWAPHGSYIVSVGEENDNEVNVWSWPARHRKATNKIKDCIHAVAFSECGNFFVTVGVRHLKFWYPNQTLTAPDACFKVPTRAIPLYGRPATLGVFKNNIFLDVCCGNSVCDKFVYVISKAGNVIILNSSRRDVCCQKNLPNDKVTCVYVLRQIIFLGTESGLIHLMSALSLQHLATLPVPANFHSKLAMERSVFTMVFNPSTRALTAVYSNTSLCVWDLGDGLNIKQSYRGVFPVDCVTDLHVVPHGEDGDRAAPHDAQGGRAHRDTLVTVSHNLHVHLWSVSTADTVTLEKLNILATEVETPIVGNVDSTYQRRNQKSMENVWCNYCWNLASAQSKCDKCNSCWNQTQSYNNLEDRENHDKDFNDCICVCSNGLSMFNTNCNGSESRKKNVQSCTLAHQHVYHHPKGLSTSSSESQVCKEVNVKQKGTNGQFENRPKNSKRKPTGMESQKKIGEMSSQIETLDKEIDNQLPNSTQNNNPKDGYKEQGCKQNTTKSSRTEAHAKIMCNEANDHKEIILNPDKIYQGESTMSCSTLAGSEGSEVDNPTDSDEPHKITTVLICKGHSKCHPDFHHIVTGNTVGNISAHDAATFQHQVTFMCHNRDVTSLAFYADGHGRMTLLSGGRDRLIHLMDARSSYRLVRTLDIHSSSINALRTVVYMGEAYLISCGADRSLKMCIAHNSQEEGRRDVSLFQLSKVQVGVSTPNDLAVCRASGELAAAYQDGYVRVFDLLSLQGLRVYKGCKGNECQVTQIALCQHGVLLISAASDRTINVINFKTGVILASMAGHYKMVTGLSFSSSGEYVISAAMDGCIFFWRLSQRLKDFQLENSNLLDQASPMQGHTSKSFNGFYLLDKDLNVEKVSVGSEKNYDIITLVKPKKDFCAEKQSKRFKR